MRLSTYAAGLVIAGTALAAGCNRNNKADVPANPEPPPAARPGAGNAPAPVAPQPSK